MVSNRCSLIPSHSKSHRMGQYARKAFKTAYHSTPWRVLTVQYLFSLDSSHCEESREKREYRTEKGLRRQLQDTVAMRGAGHPTPHPTPPLQQQPIIAAGTTTTPIPCITIRLTARFRWQSFFLLRPIAASSHSSSSPSTSSAFPLSITLNSTAESENGATTPPSQFYGRGRPPDSQESDSRRTHPQAPAPLNQPNQPNQQRLHRLVEYRTRGDALFKIVQNWDRTEWYDFQYRRRENFDGKSAAPWAARDFERRRTRTAGAQRRLRQRRGSETRGSGWVRIQSSASSRKHDANPECSLLVLLV